MVVDETNTGCGATGRGFWAYDGSMADYVSFGKRTQATGYYKAGDEGIQLGGSEINVALLGEIKKEIDTHKLISKVESVGFNLHNQVTSAAAKSKRITDVQSSGTMLWLNTANGQDAAALRDHLRREGVLVKLNGD